MDRFVPALMRGKPPWSCWLQELLRNCYKWLQVTGAAGRFEEYNYVYIYIYIINIMFVVVTIIVMIIIVVIIIFIMINYCCYSSSYYYTFIYIFLQHLEALGKFKTDIQILSFSHFPFLGWPGHSWIGMDGCSKHWQSTAEFSEESSGEDIRLL